MPPLRFDANAKVQPEPDPRLMVIVRRVRVRPTLVFQGRVEEEAVATAAATPPAPPPLATAPKNCGASTSTRLGCRSCEVLLSQALVAKRVIGCNVCQLTARAWPSPVPGFRAETGLS